jgi:RNA polymerase sigma factor for flagellar operon FliA
VTVSNPEDFPMSHAARVSDAPSTPPRSPLATAGSKPAPLPEQERQTLLREHLGLVYFVARQIARGGRGEIELDELVSAGALGLTEALDSFDSSRGLAFSTFATPRIRGAILDELRRQDHVPRSVRRKTRDLKAASDALGHDGREPSDKEMAEHLNVDVDTVRRWQLDVEGAVRVSLDASASAADEDAPTNAELLAGTTDENAEDELNRQQEVDVLARALQGLSEQERLVITLYYYEDLKLHEIAIALGVSESRVSQIRTKALGKLRGDMAPLRREVA